MIDLDWPKANDTLFNILVNGATVWNGEDDEPPTHIPTNIDPWVGVPSARDVNISVTLEALFGISAAGSEYNLSVTFNNGCQISAVN